MNKNSDNFLNDELLGMIPDKKILSELLHSQNTLSELAGVFFPFQNTDSQGFTFSEDELPDLFSRYRVLVEQIPAIVFMSFLDRGISEAYISPQIETMLGFTQAEWLDDPIRWFDQIHDDDKTRWSVEAAQMFLTGEPLRSTYRIKARDGRLVWFRCDAKMVRRKDGRPWFIHGVAFDVTEIKDKEKSLQDYADRQVELSRKLLNIQEAERRAIALELHDEIGQILTGLKLSLELTSKKYNDDSIQQAQYMVADLLTKVRKLSLDLRPATLDHLGLLPTFLFLFRNYSTQSGIEIDFNHQGLSSRRFAPEIETSVYRVVQEALTNVARYSKVKAAKVRVWADEKTISILVEDEGLGFDVELVTAAANSTGVAGMRERVQLLGGHFHIESAKNKGTKINADWFLESYKE